MTQEEEITQLRNAIRALLPFVRYGCFRVREPSTKAYYGYSPVQDKAIEMAEAVLRLEPDNETDGYGELVTDDGVLAHFRDQHYLP